MSSLTNVAVIGSGNIGTDLMVKVLHRPEVFQMAAMVGIDPRSEGLSRAARLGVPTTSDGVKGLTAMPEFEDIEVIFDATSAKVHHANAAVLVPLGKRLIDLTPAALGPFVVPTVNLTAHQDATDLNMVTCGGQATIPIVAAVTRVTAVPYAEIVASIASRSAGPGTRANIDEFTETTAAAVQSVGGAERGKAIIVLNPADPPLIMRDSVFCLINDPDPEVHRRVVESIESMVAQVANFVPGYRLKQQIQVTPVGEEVYVLAGGCRVTHRVSTFLEVEGAGDHLPAYAGNLDIMTSAAVQVAHCIAANKQRSIR